MFSEWEDCSILHNRRAHMYPSWGEVVQRPCVKISRMPFHRLFSLPTLTVWMMLCNFWTDGSPPILRMVGLAHFYLTSGPSSEHPKFAPKELSSVIKRSEQRELPAVEGFGISLKARSRHHKSALSKGIPEMMADGHPT